MLLIKPLANGSSDDNVLFFKTGLSLFRQAKPDLRRKLRIAFFYFWIKILIKDHATTLSGYRWRPEVNNHRFI